jgi:hypothetical protein
MGYPALQNRQDQRVPRKDCRHLQIELFPDRHFSERELIVIEMTDYLEWQMTSLTKYFTYRHGDPALLDFGVWLMEFVESQAYRSFVTKYLELEIQLRATSAGPLRSKLLEEQRSLKP